MVKQFIRNIVLGEKADSKRYVKYLRKLGMQIGDNVRFYSPLHTMIDLSCPWLISIGNNVSVTHGVIILTHDYSWSVLKKHPDSSGAVFGAQSAVKIGNNVFIGMNAVITRGVIIEDHVIIGAGSVVASNCEGNSVYAGNPAKKIMTIEEFFEKRKNNQFEEAKGIALEYKRCFGVKPPKEVFTEYFMLFCSIDEAKRIPQFCRQMENCGNYEESIAYMQSVSPMFDNYEAFLVACFCQDA